MSRLLEEVKRIIRINSISANGNEELMNYITTLLQARGMKTQVQQVTHSFEGISKRQFNVIGILGDPLVDKKTRKGLLLNSHLDTVSPGLPENWTETGGDPFSAAIKDGKIFGLGAADTKLDFLCKLHAIEKFRDRKLRMPIYLVGTCGEEIGMIGAKYLIKSLSLNPKYVLVGEPSELRMVYAHKCFSIFKVSVGFQQIERDARGFNRRINLYSFGKSAHGSYPHLGTNAIHQMLNFLQDATNAGFELRFTSMDGGDTVNKVPDRATMEFYLTSHQFEDFKRFFRDSVRQGGQEKAFKVELGGLGDTGVRFLPDPIFDCLLEINSFFQKLAGEFEGKVDETFFPPVSTINFGQLKQRQGGIDLYFDMRLLPNIQPSDVEARIAEGIQKISSHYPSLNLTAVREGMNPGLNMTMDHDLVRICKEAMEAVGIPVKLDKKSTSTEAAQYFQAGYEAVAFGPGASEGNSHSPNEHNILEQVEKAIQFYEKVVEKVCL